MKSPLHCIAFRPASAERPGPVGGALRVLGARRGRLRARVVVAAHERVSEEAGRADAERVGRALALALRVHAALRPLARVQLAARVRVAAVVRQARANL
jgi:hypothetical protein